MEKTISPHLDKDWLYQKYVVEGLSTYQIGKLVSRDPKQVYNKLRDFQIPTRPRGLNLKNGDCYMMQEGVINPFLGKKHTEKTKAHLSAKASIPKPYLRGKGNGMYGKTGEANPHYIDGSSPERQRLYAGSEWKAFVRSVFKRDNYTCTRCGAGKTSRKGIHVHHIAPWAGNIALRFDMGNVVTLCRKCHEWVHSSGNESKDFIL